MDREVEMAHRWTINKSTGNHDPASEGLGNEEHSHYEVNTKLFEVNFFCEKKIENGNGIRESSQPCDETMQPFDVEDVFVLLQIHIEVDLFEFGGLLIPGKFLLPGLFAEGRHGSTNGIPFGDRESRFGQARHAAVGDLDDEQDKCNQSKFVG